ncbi:MAG: class I SAM-dependent methyltransferase [Armatimonadetes bacterium]|nr:class I SAM-dependent methyltransferase [Armatimonadota bacterium]
MKGPCQVCGSTDIRDYVKHEEGHYLRCAGCGLVVNADADELAARSVEHYDDEAYFQNYQLRTARKTRSAARRIRIIRRYVPSGRLLDIGCGVGETLIAARDAGFEPVGLDVGKYPVEHCRGLGFEVHRASITRTGLPDDSFDVVTMWDVIEHIPRTSEGLREVRRILKPGGLAAIITPSCEYLRAHLWRQTYRGYRGNWAKTHLVYHHSRTLDRVLRECGLVPVPGAALYATTLPGFLFESARSALRLTKNLFVLARKEAGPAGRENVEE